MNESEIIKSMQKGLIGWYGIASVSKILYIGKSDDALADVLIECNSEIDVINADMLSFNWIDSHKAYYDYIICKTVPEKLINPVELFCKVKEIIKSSGHFLLGMNNRLGLRYFCGDRDPYTERSFDCIENYRRAYVKKEDVFCGRMYSRREIKSMLDAAGWNKIKFYSVISDLDNPSLIYANNYMPNEDLANRVFPVYNYPDAVFLEEESLYQSLIENEMFHQTANAYLIECTMNGTLSNVSHVTSSAERNKNNALFTIIYDSGVVEKRAAYPEGQMRLKKISDNLIHLKKRGISVIDAKYKNGILTMPYIKAEVGQLYLKKLIMTDKDKFISEMDRFRDLILNSSEIISCDKGDGNGVILKYGYIDFVPLNSFYINGNFVIYDQEFCEENYPANAIVWRMVATFYSGNSELNKIVPMDELLERYDLKRNQKKWQKFEWDFLVNLRNEKELRVYHEKYRRNNEVVNLNRLRINYSDSEYRRFFVDIFKGCENRKLILFGSGAYAKRFITMYGKEYPVYAIIDNNKNNHGKRLENIEINSPDLIKELSDAEYKIIICIKNFLSVVRQLKDMGVKNYSIFDPSRSYHKKIKITETYENTSSVKTKKYHIGYVAGVFDMFHVGHLNMLCRAKEQCEYLIVGIVQDEGVFRQKNKYPIIPCDERVEIVQSCRYVDHAEALPLDCCSIRDAYKLFGFDCMFTGTDYVNNSDWLAEKEYLIKNGSDIVFFPYTEKTSSTKIREKLHRGEKTENE